MSATFTEWLVKEMKERGITQAELSRMSGVSTGGISDVITGRREPGDKMARKIAQALDLPAEEVFKIAGILQGRPERTREIDQIVNIVERMPADEQKEILSYIKWKTKKRVHGSHPFS